MTQGLVDSTPLFESYHAFANRPMIVKQLEKYRVTDSEEDEAAHANDHGLYAFEENGFYRTLVRRVRAEFGAVGPDADKKSLTKETKANWFWLLKISTQMFLSAVFFYLTFFTGARFSTPTLCVLALFAGNFFIQWGFTVMHDASHFAIAPRNHWANAFMTRVWCAMSLWVCRIWMLHHAVLHHAYTGTSTLDTTRYHLSASTLTPLARQCSPGFASWEPPLACRAGRFAALFCTPCFQACGSGKCCNTLPLRLALLIGRISGA